MNKPFFKIKAIKEEKDYGKFVFEPLQQGFGTTVGNALRRTLLTNLQGAAIKQLKIEGVTHPFSTMEGMKEDIVEFILNVKQIDIAYDKEEEVKLNLSVRGSKKVTARDIKTPANVKIINKDLVLTNLTDKKAKLDVEFIVGTGVGYSPAEERKSTVLGVIPVDAAFSPIVKINTKIDSTRVGRRTDFDKLILEIWTNGSLKPRVALDRAAKVLVSFFKQVYNPVFEKEVKEESDEKPENHEILSLTLEEINLPTRIVNALRKGGYKTVGDLTKEESLKVASVKNLGKKSIDIIRKRLKSKGVNFSDESQ